MKFIVDSKKLKLLNQQKRLITSLAFGLCAVVCGFQPAQAEGSRDLYPNGAGGYRGNLEWQAGKAYGPTAPVNNSLLRRTLLQVYANKDEYILLGSSAVGVGSGDIIIYGSKSIQIGSETLSDEKFKCSTQSTSNQGKITSRTQELAGPDTVPSGSVTNGYIPCYYKAPSNGIYYVVFYGPNGGSNSTDAIPTGDIDIGTSTSKPNNFNTNQRTSVAAWDVTVRNSLTSTTDIKGRLFTDYLALFTGGNTANTNGRPIESEFYVVTKDGFRYKTNLNGLDPNGFVIYGNDVGYYNSDGKTPLYHDVLGNNGSLTPLEGGTNFALPTHTILFNNPQTNSGAIDVINARSLPLSPILPVVSNLIFSGNAGGNTSVINTGGNFSFNTNVPGSYQIVISKDGTNFDPTKSDNRVLLGLVATSGGQAVSWDGKDNSGNPFPVGANYKVQITLRNGEYHFPLIDAENSTKGGPSFTLLNATNPLGNTVGFFDDRGYKTLSGVNVGTPGSVLCGLNPPSPAFSDPIIGFDTTGISRKYGGNPGSNTNISCTGSFGDAKGLDIWTYIPSKAATSTINIVTTASSLTANKTVALVVDSDKSGGTTPLSSQVPTPGDILEYTVIVKNTSTTTQRDNVVLKDTIPANTTYIVGTLDIDGVAKTDPTDTDQAEFASSQAVFRLGTGANGTTGGTIAASATSTIKFRVKINDPLPNGITTVSNQAVISSNGVPDINSNDPGTPTADDPTVTKIAPRLRLVKRVTGIKKEKNTTVTTIGGYNDLATDVNDDMTVGWTPNANTYLLGAIADSQIPTNPGAPAPEDEVEYTIYFLVDGGIPAKEVDICDFIPANQTYVPGTMQLNLNGGTTSAIADTPGAGGGFYTASFPAACLGTNNNQGAADFKVGNLNSNFYGYIRFRAKVN
jgi:uncharacterized repeat protein (TIGR01451 family)